MDRSSENRLYDPRHMTPALDIKYAIAGLIDYKISYFDQWVDPLSESSLLTKVEEIGPSLVFIRGTSFCFEESISLSKKLKERGHTTVAFGQQVSHLERMDVDIAYKCFDLILNGEVELEIPKVVDYFESYGKDEALAHYKEKFLNKHYNLVDRPELLPNIDFKNSELEKYNFPFPIRGKLYKKSAYLLTAWGCPHKCSFCTLIVRKTAGDNLRRRSIESVVNEIERNLNQGAEFIFIEDDTFLCNKSHFISFCNKVLKRNLKFNWMCNGRVDEVSEEMMSLGQQAGLKLIKLGIETGSQQVIEALGKAKSGTTWHEQIQRTYKILNKYEIGSVGLFMVKMPTETMDDFKQTAKLLKEINPDYLQVQIFTPYPEVTYFKELENKINLEKNLCHYSLTDTDVSKISTHSGKELQNTLYKNYYCSLRFIKQHLLLNWHLYLRPNIIVKIVSMLKGKFKTIIKSNFSEAI